MGNMRNIPSLFVTSHPFFELRYAKGRDRFRLGQHSEAIRQDAYADTSRHAVHVRHDSHRRCFHRTWGRKRRAGGSEHILAFLAPDDGHRNDAWHRLFGRVVDSPVPGQCQGRENQHDPDIDLCRVIVLLNPIK